jgi:hypothetical protein
MKAVEDLNGLREQLRGGVPDPSRTIAQYDAAGSFGEATACSFAQYALSELAPVGTGIQSGGAFDGGRIGDRSWIPHGLIDLAIPRSIW